MSDSDTRRAARGGWQLARFLVPVAYLAGLVLVTGCTPLIEVVYSEKRRVERQSRFFAIALANVNFDRAKTFMTKDCGYYPFGGNDKKALGPQTFFDMITGIHARSGFVITVKKIGLVGGDKSKMMMIVEFKGTQADMTRMTNTTWDGTILWISVNGAWKIAEIKETTAHQTHSS